MFVRISDGRLLNVLRIAAIYPKEHLQARGAEYEDDEIVYDDNDKPVPDDVECHLAVIDGQTPLWWDARTIRDRRLFVSLNDNDLELVLKAIEKTVGLM